MAQNNNKNGWLFLIIFIGVITVIKMVNDHIARDVQTITKVSPVEAISISPAEPPPQPSPRYRRPGDQVVRKDLLSPGRDYIESFFYLNTTEVAKQKIVNDKIVESSGEIPDGRTDFVNESQETYGVEHYTHGEKSGSSQTYFVDGQLNVEAFYRQGKLLWKKEYFHNGSIRLEVNYEDARELADPKETGIGKVYYLDGTLKYEWNLTNSEKIGFKKSYNQDGQLRAAFYFDEHGQQME